LQLGATDESHIIRTIENWDYERRRYPQYDHGAVIVAEYITSRFLNVIALFNGFIQIIAIQLRALELVSGEVLLGVLPSATASEPAPSVNRHGDMICPRCGSLKVERRGRRGAFCGCRPDRRLPRDPAIDPWLTGVTWSFHAQPKREKSPPGPVAW
jgi:hypothetical protein